MIARRQQSGWGLESSLTTQPPGVALPSSSTVDAAAPALGVRVRVPLILPTVCGTNAITSVQVWPDARPPQVELLILKLAPLEIVVPTVIVPGTPWLSILRLRSCSRPSSTAPNCRVPTVAPTPLEAPIKLTLVKTPPLLGDRVKRSSLIPTEPGANSIGKTQLLPAVMPAMQVFWDVVRIW